MQTSKPEISQLEQRILVFSQKDCDASESHKLLSEAGVASVLCHNAAKACEELHRGAAALLLTEESLAQENQCLVDQIAAQPAWSDMPIIVLTAGTQFSDQAKTMIDQFGNVMLLERPVRLATLISAIRTALRARRRQYQVRQHLEERSRSEETAHFLASASELLSSSLDLEKTLSLVAKLVVPQFADWCGVSLVDSEGNLHSVAVAHSDSDKAKSVQDLRLRYQPSRKLNSTPYRVLDSGKPEIYSEVTDEMLRANAVDDEHLSLMRDLQIRSLVLVPLKTAGNAQGVMSLVYAESNRRYGHADLPFFEELAKRCALAVENAKLYRDAQHELLERKAAEEALRRSEKAMRDLNAKLEQRVAELDAVIESIPDAVFIGNVEGITICNSQALEMAGVDSVEELGQHMSMISKKFHPRDPQSNRPLELEELPFTQAMRGTPATRDITFDHLKSGETRVWRCAAAPIRRGSNVVGAIAVSTDITERNESEENLRHHQERLQAALEASSTGTFRWDARRNVLEWDENLYRIFNARPGSVTQLQDFLDLIHPDDRGRVMEAFEHSIKFTEEFEQEFRVTWSDGSVHWISDKGRCVFGEQGEPLHMVGACIDITGRKQAEETLMYEHALVELERSRLRAVLDVLPMGVFIADASGQLLETNAVARVMWGGKTPLSKSPEDYANDYRAWWPETGQRLKSHEWGLARALKGEIVTAEELEIETYVGQRKTILNYALPIRNSAGNLVGAVAVNVDITMRKREEQERKRLESQFQHAQKMESLGVLAGGVAHDFNNLLVGILGNAGLALAETPADSDVHEFLRGIETASRRAADLCRQMLAYSGKGRFFIEEVNLNYLVQEMNELLAASVSKKAFMQFEPAENLPAIEADATQARQVIMNLITNASEAVSDKGGSITISTGQMYCDRQFLSQTLIDEYIPEGVYVYLRIADTGEGMDEETAARIFDPFFTTKFTGRGLGLAAVLGIVRGHRGAMQVHSELGVGSTFTIFFPALDKIAHTPHVEPATARPSKMTGTVLLVDDSDTVRAVAGRMLENAGFTVLMATDGVEGVEMFQRHHESIDCVLLDLTMPRMDGEEAFHEMRKIQSDACIILSTGYNEQESLSLFEGEYLDGFVQKPYQAAELVNQIHDAITSRRESQRPAGR